MMRIGSGFHPLHRSGVRKLHVVARPPHVMPDRGRSCPPHLDTTTGRAGSIRNIGSPRATDVLIVLGEEAGWAFLRQVPSAAKRRRATRVNPTNDRKRPERFLNIKMF